MLEKRTLKANPTNDDTGEAHDEGGLVDLSHAYDETAEVSEDDHSVVDETVPSLFIEEIDEFVNDNNKRKVDEMDVDEPQKVQKIGDNTLIEK